VWGLRKKEVPKKNQHGLKRGKKNMKLEFVTLVSPGTRRDKEGQKKRYPISAPSIHIGALVGVGSL
jgi:hypothetical protein